MKKQSDHWIKNFYQKYVLNNKNVIYIYIIVEIYFMGFTKVFFNYWFGKKVKLTLNQWLRNTLVSLIKKFLTMSINNTTFPKKYVVMGWTFLTCTFIYRAHVNVHEELVHGCSLWSLWIYEEWMDHTEEKLHKRSVCSGAGSRSINTTKTSSIFGQSYVNVDNTDCQSGKDSFTEIFMCRTLTMG